MGILALTPTILFAEGAGITSGLPALLRVPLLLLGLFGWGLAGFVLIVVLIRILLRLRLGRERAVIAMARKSARREGEVVKEGLMTVWYSGPDDPLPMLREQIETGRRRFDALTGEATPAEKSHRVLVFHDRTAFLRFHQRIAAGLDFTTFDGLYLGHPAHVWTLCTSTAIGRITDPERTVRSLAGYALLESTWGRRPPAWLQSGLSRAVSNGDDCDGLARLNRKMLASMSGGTTLSVEIFSMTLNVLTRLLRNSNEPRQYQKFQQFHFQAWSMLVFLSGADAAHDSRKPLGAFLRDPRSKRDQEEALRAHFGRGYAPLLEGWRQWVLDQGIGTYEPPPDRIRDGLIQRVLPVIRDRQAKRGDRIASIRYWAGEGFVLGADALIDLLHDPGDIPKEDVVWALGMVSGLSWGDDADRWQAWWNDLPLEWDEPREATAMV